MHNRLKGIDSKTVEKILKRFSFQLIDQKGSHQHWKNNNKRRVEVIANAKSFTRSTLKSMMEQSGYSEGDWLLALDET